MKTFKIRLFKYFSKESRYKRANKGSLIRMANRGASDDNLNIIIHYASRLGVEAYTFEHQVPENIIKTLKRMEILLK